MTVVLINPNSTEAMTQSALAAARATSPDVDFDGWTSRQGPPSIEGPDDGDRAIPPLLDLVKQASDGGAEAIIIACFDDTGLSAAKKLAKCPVIGIGQASFVLASLLSGPTVVVTTVAAAVPVITANVVAQGFGAVVTDVVAADVPVLTLANDPATALRDFVRVAQSVPPETENLILGCSAAVAIQQDLQQSVRFRVIDGVTAAARLCRVLAAPSKGRI